jgi:hypothetical protein
MLFLPADLQSAATLTDNPTLQKGYETTSRMKQLSKTETATRDGVTAIGFG